MQKSTRTVLHNADIIFVHILVIIFLYNYLHSLPHIKRHVCYSVPRQVCNF